MKTIAVFGSSLSQPDHSDYLDALEVGRVLGQAGYAVMTGGYEGVMEAASRGAVEANAHVIGVTCAQIETFRRIKVNRWVIEEIKYQTLNQRLDHLITHADGYVVMPGGVGTMNELILAWELMRIGEVPLKPLVCFGKFWEETLSNFIASDYIPAKHRQQVMFAHTPGQVVQRLQNGKSG